MVQTGSLLIGLTGFTFTLKVSVSLYWPSETSTVTSEYPIWLSWVVQSTNPLLSIAQLTILVSVWEVIVYIKLFHGVSKSKE